MRGRLGLAAVIAGSLSAAVLAAETVTVPKGKPITVDGIAVVDEWNDATAVGFRGGEQFLLKQDGEHLLLLIQGQKRGISSVAIHADDEVRILHASAGLITAIYRKDGELWRQTEEFRSPRQPRAARGESHADLMEKNLELYDWCATILPVKPPVDFDARNLTEYKISLGLLTNGVSTLSLVFSQRTAELPFARAPADLSDDSLNRAMVHGSNVATLRFHPDTWLRLSW